MGEIIALVFCIGIFLAGFISGKSIYKDELNDLDHRFRKKALKSIQNEN